VVGDVSFDPDFDVFRNLNYNLIAAEASGYEQSRVVRESSSFAYPEQARRRKKRRRFSFFEAVFYKFKLMRDSSPA